MALDAGHIEAATLAEALAVDHATLLLAVAPGLPVERVAPLRASAKAGITLRMRLAAELLAGHAELARLAGHPSDTVRGWAAFALAGIPGLPLERRLCRVRRFAEDGHFGVREWAWLAVRPAIVAEPDLAVALLAPWSRHSSANLRRFASEATRPRGVWATHIAPFKREPERGLPVLEPLRADPSPYVQDSVANWINDAARTRPDWVRLTCERWAADSDAPATRRICRRALRSLG
jgi:3-methyladenine DNA glycosylase AlkC